MPKLSKNIEARVRAMVTPGCVVNLESNLKWWGPQHIPKSLLMTPVHRTIRNVQKYDYPDGNYRDVHSMQWLKGNGFEMTWPKGKFWDFDEIRNKKLSIYQPVPEALGYEIDNKFILDMRQAAYKLEGRNYDFWELIDHILGYQEPAGFIKIFGSENRFVCSSTVGVLWEYARKEKEKRDGVNYDRLFFYPDGRPHPVERYRPADFANTPKFKLKYHWRYGIVK